VFSEIATIEEEDPESIWAARLIDDANQSIDRKEYMCLVIKTESFGAQPIDRNLKTQFWWIRIEALIPNV